MAALNLVGGKKTLVLLVCSWPPEFMDKVEIHYGKYRHTESAVGVHNLTDETLRTGSNRCKSKSVGENVWNEILTVTQEAVRRNHNRVHQLVNQFWETTTEKLSNTLVALVNVFTYICPRLSRAIRPRRAAGGTAVVLEDPVQELSNCTRSWVVFGQHPHHTPPWVPCGSVQGGSSYNETDGVEDTVRHTNRGKVGAIRWVTRDASS